MQDFSSTTFNSSITCLEYNDKSSIISFISQDFSQDKTSYNMNDQDKYKSIWEKLFGKGINSSYILNFYHGNDYFKDISYTSKSVVYNNSLMLNEENVTIFKNAFMQEKLIKEESIVEYIDSSTQTDSPVVDINKSASLELLDNDYEKENIDLDKILSQYNSISKNIDIGLKSNIEELSYYKSKNYSSEWDSDSNSSSDTVVTVIPWIGENISNSKVVLEITDANNNTYKVLDIDSNSHIYKIYKDKSINQDSSLALEKPIIEKYRKIGNSTNDSETWDDYFKNEDYLSTNYDGNLSTNYDGNFKIFSREIDYSGILKEFLSPLSLEESEVFKSTIISELYRQDSESKLDLNNKNFIKSLVLFCAYEDYVVFDYPDVYISYLEKISYI